MSQQSSPKQIPDGGACCGEFPNDFLWGVATAAYQIEGAAAEDGRKPSVWDTFSKTPGKVRNGDTGDVACDHYHRFEEDIKLMAALGVKHYRFSISWPRIIPEGRGAVNRTGLDFYHRLIDSLLKHGITPHITLFHWDSPQALEDRYGSWRSREMASDFADYCSAVVKSLGSKVRHWMTMNEIFCFTYLGYGVGTEPHAAPCTVLNSRKELSQVVHHAILAHGMGCQAIRAASPVPPHVSVVVNYDSFVPIIETPEHIEAARRAFLGSEPNGTILEPIITGKYSDQTLQKLGANAPEVKEGDLRVIGQPLDSLGFNTYTGAYARVSSNEPGYEVLPFPKQYPKIQVSWLSFLPEAVYWGVRMIGDALGKPDLPIYITENGCPSDDDMTPSGEVFDLTRITYIRSYLRNAQRAIAEGYPLKGYFLWSLLDNFEWADGYGTRFGLVHTDYPTQKRIPKLGYYWYQQVIRKNCIV